LLIILVIPPLTGISKQFGGHGHDGYLEIATNVIRGHGFAFEPGGKPVLHRPPLYPLLISPLTLLPKGLWRISLIILQSAIAGGIAFLIFRIGKHLFSDSIARIAVIIFLLNPWVYWHVKNPMTPVLQGFLYILFVYLIGGNILGVLENADAPRRRKKWWTWYLAIAGAGAALILTHGTMIASVFSWLFILFIAGMFRKSYRTAAASIVSGMIIVILIIPWTYRNWIVLKRFVPVTNNYGAVYVQGLVHWNICGKDACCRNEDYEAATLRFLGIKGDTSTYMQYWGFNDPNLDTELNKKVKEYIRMHPAIFFEKLLLNSIDYYFPTIVYPFLAVKTFSVEELALTLFHSALWGLAFIGIWRGRGQKKLRLQTILMLLPIILYAVWYLPFVTFIGHRLYTFGTIPFLSLLAARGFNTIRPNQFCSSQTSAS
jgi:4-amino-4-deoxy-L-arabinose transferase-like glycosyltransferase